MIKDVKTMNTNEFFSIDPFIEEASRKAEELVRPALEELDAIAEYNQLKVLAAFQKHGVSESFFYGSTGYGYGDRGRDALDAIYADVFGTEDALVRHHFVSGTHALTVALFGVLRTGDTLLSITGKPYDTLEEVIGIRGEDGNGSLKDYGVSYAQVDLLENGMPDLPAITEAVKAPGVKVAYIQRSRGYSLRPSYTVEQIAEMVKAIKAGNPDAIIMVDNCYGEFAQRQEPTQVGADL